MNCKHCQAPLEEDTLICPSCGKSQEEALPESPIPVEELSEEEAFETAPEEAVELPAPKKKTWVRALALVLAVVLVLGLGTGIWYSINGGFYPRENNLFYKDCYTNDKTVANARDTVIATCGDRTLTNGQLQIHYWLQFFNFVQQNSYYLSYIGLDYTQPLYTQYAQESQTWEQYFLEAGLSNWHRFQALLLHAEAEGFQMPNSVAEYVAQLPESLQTQAQSYGYTDVEELLAQDMGTGCGLDEYVDYMGMYAAAMEYMDALYTRFEPTEDQVRDYVTANAAAMEEAYGVTMDSGNALVDIRHVLIQPEDCEFDERGYVVATEDQWETCRLEGQALLDAWAAEGATEEGFAELAKAHSVDGNASQGGIYTDVTPGQMVESFNDWCFDTKRQSGDYGLVRTEYGYHLMYFVEGTLGWLYYGTEDYISEKCSAVIAEAMAAYPMEADYKKIVLGTALSLVSDGE